MYFPHHPGHWQHFLLRNDNRGLTVEQVRQKYVKELALYESVVAVSATSAASAGAAGGAGGGGGLPPTPPPVLSLRLTFDDIENVEGVINDPTNVSDWNTYFELPDYGSEFTSVTVDGGLVTLSGGSNITLKESLFDQADELGTYLLEVDDDGCVVEVELGAFGDSNELGCPNLTSVNLPNATTIGTSAFSGCASLTTIDLAKTTEVGEAAFYGCTSLTTIDLPSAVIIGNGAFEGCTSLVIVSLRVCTNLGGTTADDAVFLEGGLDKEMSITVPEAIKFDGDLIYASLDNTLVVNDSSYAPYVGFSGSLVMEFNDVRDVPFKSPELVANWNNVFNLPSWSTPFTSVTVVGATFTLEGGKNIVVPENFLTQNTGLISVADDGCVVYVRANAFSYCTALTTVDLPNANVIGLNAFEYSDLLSNVNLPSAVSVGELAFSQCTSLTTVELPSAIKIGYGAFADCAALTSIELPACTNLGGSTADDAVFDRISGNTITLTVPSALMTADARGNPDGDIAYLQDNNTVTVVTV